VKLTSRVVAPIILLDVVHTVAARTLLREFADGLETCGFLRLLVPFLVARCTILVLVACFLWPHEIHVKMLPSTPLV
jgi:hypothetical protein